MVIRRIHKQDHDALWRVIEPTLRAGETWALPRDWSRDEALGYWLAPTRDAWIADRGSPGDPDVVGAYYLQPAQLGPGAHVANAGYMVRTDAWGGGVAGEMCDHSLSRARALGFRAMQFNLVVSTNTRAIALWERKGFVVIGRSPASFMHAELGAVDALIMHRTLDPER